MSSQTLKEEIKDFKIFINSVTREAVDEALVSSPFPSEKRVELAEAISIILLNKYAYLKAMLTYTNRCANGKQNSCHGEAVFFEDLFHPLAKR